MGRAIRPAFSFSIVIAVLILNERDVEDLLPMHECIDVLQRAFATLDEAGYVQPLRLIAWNPARTGAVAAMPAWMAQPPAMGAKLISVFPQNGSRGLDSHQGFVALYDPENGKPLALLHAGAITAIRTAAVSAVATRLLANGGPCTLAIIGSGVQARTHLQAMLAVCDVRAVRVWSRTAAHAQRFATVQQRECGIQIESVASPQEAVENAELICTVSASREPIVRGEWLRAGAHVNAAGASVPGFRELDETAIVRARLYVDSRESAMAEADELRIPIGEGRIGTDRIIGTLPELAASKCEARRTPEDVTIFKSCGMAVEDLAAASYVYEKALAQNRGTAVAF